MVTLSGLQKAEVWKEMGILKELRLSNSHTVSKVEEQGPVTRIWDSHPFMPWHPDCV